MCRVQLLLIRDAVTLGTQSFTLSEYSTLAVAKVWSNTAKLPSSQTMRELCEETAEKRGGYGKRVLFLGRERLPGKLIRPFLVPRLSFWSCYSHDQTSDRLAERGRGQIRWQAGSLHTFLSTFRR